MKRKTLAALASLVGLLLVVTPAPAGVCYTYVEYSMPVFPGVIGNVLGAWNFPAGSSIVSTMFSGTFDNRASGGDAADAEYQLFLKGTQWTVKGSHMGWSGAGRFSGYRTTSKFNGSVSGTVYWETVTYAVGKTDAEFRILVRQPTYCSDPGGPDRPDRP